jgi:hypothetical protein
MSKSTTKVAMQPAAKPTSILESTPRAARPLDNVSVIFALYTPFLLTSPSWRTYS